VSGYRLTRTPAVEGRLLGHSGARRSRATEPGARTGREFAAVSIHKARSVGARAAVWR